MKVIQEFERRAAEAVLARDAAGRPFHDARWAAPDDLDRVPAGDRTAAFYAVPEHAVPGRGYGRGRAFAGDAGSQEYPGGHRYQAAAAGDRMSLLINHGRGSAYHPGLVRRHKIAFGLAASVLVLIIVLVALLLSGGASWPASAATMQAQLTTTCQNPDVTSEPGQDNAACTTRGTRQIPAAPAVTAPTGTGSDQEPDGNSDDPAPVTAPMATGDHQPDGDSDHPATGQAAPAPSSSAGTSTAPATHTGGSSFQQCVISRESGGNPTAVNPTTGAGGLYQFLPSTWASLGYSGLPQNAPVSVQNQAFAKLYAQAGTSPWAPYDGC